MLKVFFRNARLTQPLRAARRPFSTTLYPSIVTRPTKATKIIDALQKETRDPIWKLLYRLNAPFNRLELITLLAKQGLSTDQYHSWKPVLLERDISTALDTLRQHGFAVGAPQTTSSRLLPPWVILHLVGYKVRTHQHAMGPLLDLVYAYLGVFPSRLRGPLLVLAMANLSRLNLVVPMQRVAGSFLVARIEHQRLNFNLMLQAVLFNPTHSRENADIIISILKAIDARQLRLDQHIAHLLRRDRFVMVQLTKYLRQRMVQQGIVPKAEHLEAYLRFFSQNNTISASQPHSHTATNSECLESSSSSSDAPSTTSADDPASALTFLQRLAGVDPQEKPTPLSVRPHKRFGPGRLHWTSPDIFQLTKSLHEFSQKPDVSASRLISAFHFLMKFAKPTVATCTVLIEGLLRRKDPRATTYWRHLLRTGLTIDREALSAGLRALTYAERPHEAFATLETFAARDNRSSMGIYRIHRSLSLTSITINDFLVALNRIGRPDVVFRLWDHMGELYGVYPDGNTLSIVLQSALTASRKDDSFAGAIAQLSLKYPLRSPPPPDTPQPRKTIAQSIEALVGDLEKGLKPYKSGIWHNRPPVDAAIHVFQQIVFLHDDAVTKLAAVQAPAHAVRSAADEDALTGLGLPKLRPRQTTFVPPEPDSAFAGSQNPYTHLRITPENLYHYILLLGLTARATEIPLTLAWMRALDVRPWPYTLALALSFWSEISVQAPLVESWQGGVEKNEYTKLVEWLREWIGEEGMPSEELLAKASYRIYRMREEH